MSLVELKVDRIQYSETQTGAYVLFLNEPLSGKKLPIVIGGLEAHSITIGLEKDLIPQRPLTHDLMKSLMMAYSIKLKKVIINKFDQGIFHALLVTEKDGIEKAIDSRTSDAVALAVRFDVPIFCESSILEEAGIFLPGSKSIKTQDELEEEINSVIEDLLSDETEPATENSKEEADPIKVELNKLSLDLFGKKRHLYSKKEIEKMLQTAIVEERYEDAAKLKRYLELKYHQ